MYFPKGSYNRKKGKSWIRQKPKGNHSLSCMSTHSIEKAHVITFYISVRKEITDHKSLTKHCQQKSSHHLWNLFGWLKTSTFPVRQSGAVPIRAIDFSKYLASRLLQQNSLYGTCNRPRRIFPHCSSLNRKWYLFWTIPVNSPFSGRLSKLIRKTSWTHHTCRLNCISAYLYTICILQSWWTETTTKTDHIFPQNGDVLC